MWYQAKSRSRKFAQDDKWNFCLTVAIIAANRRDLSRRPRQTTPGFKAKVALAAIKGDRMITQLAERFDAPPNQMTTWKAELEGPASEVFGSVCVAPAVLALDVKSLHVKIGELTLENDFRRRPHQGGIAERKTMIDCQSAFKFAPISASNFDAFERARLAVAFVLSEQAGMASRQRG